MIASVKAGTRVLRLASRMWRAIALEMTRPIFWRKNSLQVGMVLEWPKKRWDLGLEESQRLCARGTRPIGHGWDMARWYMAAAKGRDCGKGLWEGDGLGREVGAVGCSHHEGVEHVSPEAIRRYCHGDEDTVGGIKLADYFITWEGWKGTAGRNPVPAELSLLLLKQVRKVG